MRTHKLSYLMLVVTPLVLTACGTTASSSQPSSLSSLPGALNASKDHMNDTYAGYECDLNGDGTISESEKGLTWANSYDKIIKTIKTTTDETLRFKLMHAAETELMGTYALTPIYYYTDLFLKKESLTGFFAMPLGYKFFYGCSGSFTACIASQPGSIDPALNTTVDGGTYDEHLFEGLYRWSYTGDYPSGAVNLVPGLASEAPTVVANEDTTVTYTFKLRSGLKWSDGSDLTAADIVRSWKRAVSTTVASDYAYLFEIIKGGAEAEGEDDGHSLDVEATDATTLKVTLLNDVTYFKELMAFPTFAPVPASADAGGEWAALSNASTFVCNGPMKIKAYSASSIELEPNPYYYNPELVKATDINFAFSDDDGAMLNSYKSGSYAFIDSFPNDQIETIAATYPKEYFNVGQLGTYYLNWNINSTIFDEKLDSEAKRVAFREALSLLINRQYICDSVAKGGQQPANGYVSKGLTGANGVGDWTDSNGPKQDGAGWYKTSTADYAANAAQAVELLKRCGFTFDEGTGKFTDIPAFPYIYNTGVGHKDLAQAIQGMFSNYGITMTLANQDWATFVATRKSGDYTFARNGWLCDYNDPISMLDMWISGSGNNDARFGVATEKDAA